MRPSGGSATVPSTESGAKDLSKRPGERHTCSTVGRVITINRPLNHFDEATSVNKLLCILIVFRAGLMPYWLA